jgi:gamma-glutamylcyclotransferase (GGCT)/AIG2-like uncharacterized protein YtfP
MNGMDSVLPAAVFVYGTLKQGEERARFWPRPALSIEAAEIRGRLHDLGPYPALIDGEDRIAGELWRLAPEDMQETLRVLDAIECFDQGGVDLYVRRVVAGATAGGEPFQAWSYFYGAPARIAHTPIVARSANGLCRWPISE